MLLNYLSPWGIELTEPLQDKERVTDLIEPLLDK